MSPSTSFDDLVQCPPFVELHHDEVTIAIHALIEDLDDIGVGEAPSNPCLAFESEHVIQFVGVAPVQDL